jgi:ferredoxin-nitrate reductase
METGVPLSPDQYRAMAPNGRAIFKAAHYHPAPEAANDEYPFTLATGRRVHHFHTRTKTGRVKSLQGASSPSLPSDQKKTIRSQ